jgi:hypothetical protein
MSSIMVLEAALPIDLHCDLVTRILLPYRTKLCLSYAGTKGSFGWKHALLS